MTLRAHLLRHPHMEPLRDHPEVADLSDAELRGTEAFMRFCADNHIAAPSAADVHAFAVLRDLPAELLRDLSNSLRRLGVGAALIDDINLIYEAQLHRADFRGITKGPNRDYRRSVSVPLHELPDDWRRTLRRLRAEADYARSILDRMEARLCMFAWSARQAGRPIDLADPCALRALYKDLRARSIARQRASTERQGHHANIDAPRWAYLRSTWEELRRFARAHDLPEDVWDNLTRTYSVLVAKESRKTAEKLAKARTTGTRVELLQKAEVMLAKVDTLSNPQMRQALRNRAAAIALGCAVPARPADIHAHHRFGAGLAFEPSRNGYRFSYKAGKTAGTMGVDVDIPLLPWWNKFIDALILQDADARYLNQLRNKAISERRLLYVHYDSTPAAYPWYSRMWSIVAGTGGHIARTLIYDEGIAHGAEGVQYARASNGHSPTSSIVRRYESERVARARIKHSQDTMADLFGEDQDDE